MTAVLVLVHELADAGELRAIADALCDDDLVSSCATSAAEKRAIVNRTFILKILRPKRETEIAADSATRFRESFIFTNSISSLEEA